MTGDVTSQATVVRSLDLFLAVIVCQKLEKTVKDWIGFNLRIADPFSVMDHLMALRCSAPVFAVVGANP